MSKAPALEPALLLSPIRLVHPLLSSREQHSLFGEKPNKSKRLPAFVFFGYSVDNAIIYGNISLNGIVGFPHAPCFFGQKEQTFVFGFGVVPGLMK
jgi:hypothetical protein